MSQSVSYLLRLGGYVRVKTYHFPLGGTIMGAAVLFVVVVVLVVVLVVDMTFLVRLDRIQGYEYLTGSSKMRGEIDHVKSRYT